MLNAAAAAGRIVYEQAGTLHLLDPASKKTTDLSIAVAGDLLETRPRWAKGAKWIRGAALSPSGARAAFEFRGEIVTVPAEKGDARNLTNTTAAHERAPAWSPDGKEIAYVSDESGENELVVRAQDGKGAPKKIKVPGAGFYDELAFSPDGKKIVLTDNSLTLFIVDVASGASKKIATERLYAPTRQRMLRGSWSPDSRWVAYTLSGPTYIRTAFVYSVDEDKSYALTDGLSDVSDPVFDRAGKYLYFLASTDAGPQRNWFSLQNTDARTTNAIYVATLKKGTPSPLAKESDEEKGEAAAKDGKSEEKEKEEDSSKGREAGRPTDPKDADQRARPTRNAKPPKPPEPVVIDRDGFNLRIVDLPVHPAEISNLQAGSAGQVFFQRTADGKTSVQRFDFKDRKTETVVPEADDYFVSFDGKKILFRQKDKDRRAGASGSSAEGVVVDRLLVPEEGRREGRRGRQAEGRLGRQAQARRDRRAHRPARRVARDLRRGLAHQPRLLLRPEDARPRLGGDEGEVRRRSSRTSRRAATSTASSSGCAASSPSATTGTRRATPSPRSTPVPGGLLGADYEVANGRYRFKKVYGGLNWNPELRAPLSEPGVEVKAGEYLLAVERQGPRAAREPLRALRGHGREDRRDHGRPDAGRHGLAHGQRRPDRERGAAAQPRLGRGQPPEGRRRDGRARRVRLRPEHGGPRPHVLQALLLPAGRTRTRSSWTSGSTAAAASPTTTSRRCTRQPIACWAMRYGEDLKTPSASIQGPKVMLIDETAGSGGDLLPWMFRKFKVGTLVGQRTWGGLVGILGFPTLMDGAVVTAPNLGFWTPEDGFGVENVGVPPDVEVEQTPADVIAGHDPQLEKAIAIVMEELKKNPPAEAEAAGDAGEVARLAPGSVLEQ